MITSDPPAQVEAVLEPVRMLADETVLAVDSRVDPGILGAYAELVDTVYRIQFLLVERHLAWVHAQCSGDWILKLDSDEVPSSAFVERLPELIADRLIAQYWVPRAWVYGSSACVLDDLPWATDFNNRLVRNDGGLWFEGEQHAHAAPAFPARYIEEPVYHLELLLEDEPARRAKAIRYEVARPHLRANGGGRLNEAFYLPELRTSLLTRKVPGADRRAIERVLRGGAATTARLPLELPSVPLAELDRHWPGRAYPETAYRVRIEPFGPTPRLHPIREQTVFVRVTNLGTERLPGRPEPDPSIRLAYRLYGPDGSAVVAEGLRTPLPGPVDPGQTVVAPLTVVAPTKGRHVLEVDLVHERVRWFGDAVRISVEVGESLPGLPAEGERLSEQARRPRLRRGPEIPRVVHRVWLGSGEFPDDFRRYGESWAEHHPRWELRLWGDDDIPELGLTAFVESARTTAELSNLVRYKVLAQHGGVYVDTDVECRRSIEPLIGGLEAFAALEAPGRVGNAVLGAVPGHPAFIRAAREAERTLGIGRHSADANGPYFLSLLLEQEPGVTILGADTFYPFRRDELERRDGDYANAYAVHHSTQLWKAEEGV
jgi:glycosyl transferase-like sugar-binding protein